MAPCPTSSVAWGEVERRSVERVAVAMSDAAEAASKAFVAFSAALPTRVFDLDPDDGYLPEEALCLVCNLTHYARLSTCPECKDLR